MPAWAGVGKLSPQEFITRHLGRISEGEIVSGIPGSRKNHFGEDYGLTEEFVSVYRMHPLMPEALVLRRHEDNQEVQELKFISENFDDRDLATPAVVKKGGARWTPEDIGPAVRDLMKRAVPAQKVWGS